MKKIIVSVTMLAMIAMFGNEILAKDKKAPEVSTNAVQTDMEIAQIGQDQTSVYLRLRFKKQDAKLASLRITDGAGEELFVERFSKEEYARIIKISPDEIKNIEVEFRTASGNLRKKYAIHMSRINSFEIEEVAAK
jgi:hypothetical protein